MGKTPRYLTAVWSIILAPAQLGLFLADCVLRPRPWDSAAWTQHDRAR